MYMDSYQLDELAQAYAVCVIRITDKTIQQSNAIDRLSNYVFWVGASGLIFATFFAQDMIWISLFWMIGGAFMGCYATRIVKSLRVPSPQEIKEGARKFTDELPDDLGEEERNIGNALTQAIVAEDIVLIRELLIEIEREECARVLRNWRFTAIAREAFKGAR